jgi:hypothetical protein
MARLTTLIFAGSKRSAIGAPHPQRPSEPTPWPLRTVESPTRMMDGRAGLAGPVRPRPFSWVAASGGAGRTAAGSGRACWAASASSGIRHVTAAASRAGVGRAWRAGMEASFGRMLVR